MDSQIKVTVAGCGTVGSGVVEMLTEKSLREATGQDVKLKYIVDIKDVKAPEGVTLTSDFDKAISDTSILCETIGGTGIAYKYTKAALEKGVSVVTSNKALVATHGDELRRIAQENGAWYLCEAAVCGGVPVLRPIKTCLAGNTITRMDGIVNGSTNYLITRMAKDGVSFPAALGEAKRLGFVEANPDDDLLGYDARRKLAILANAAFSSKLSDDGLIPTDGITRLTREDVLSFAKIGFAVRLIAHAERLNSGWTGWVRPAIVPEGNPLYGVDGVFNALLINGDFVDDVMFYGRGAGMKPTASAIVGDIIEIARSLDRPFHQSVPESAVPAFADPLKREAKVAFRAENDVKFDGIPIERTHDLGDCRIAFTGYMPMGELISNEIFSRPGVGIPLMTL